MSNRILDAYVTTHHADPAGAELRVVVRPEMITPATEVKGRLMGPRSVYTSTVEIAYPFRELARSDHILLRVLIPEPNFWEPKSPLLYEGPLELWQDGARVDQVWLRHGIRTVQLGPTGLRVNGKLTTLQGICRDSFTAEDIRAWRADNINLVMMPARDEVMELFKLTDRLGLFVLGRIEEEHQWPRWPLACQRFSSFLGTVVPPRGVSCFTRVGLSLRGSALRPDGQYAAGQFDFFLVPYDDELMIVPNGPAQIAIDRLGWIRR